MTAPYAAGGSVRAGADAAERVGPPRRHPFHGDETMTERERIEAEIAEHERAAQAARERLAELRSEIIVDDGGDCFYTVTSRRSRRSGFVQINQWYGDANRAGELLLPRSATVPALCHAMLTVAEHRWQARALAAMQDADERTQHAVALVAEVLARDGTAESAWLRAYVWQDGSPHVQDSTAGSYDAPQVVRAGARALLLAAEQADEGGTDAG